MLQNTQARQVHAIHVHESAYTGQEPAKSLISYHMERCIDKSTDWQAGQDMTRGEI